MMNDVSPGPSIHRRTLLAELRRSHLLVVMVASLAVLLSMSVATTSALRSYADQNQTLVARTMAYTLEAVMVFRDAELASEELVALARQEALAYARITLSDGTVLAEYRQDVRNTFEAIELWLARQLLPRPSLVAVEHDSSPLGHVAVQSNGRGLIGLVFAAVAGLLTSMLAIALALAWLSRRVRREILQPLATLAEVTHSMRESKHGQRVPPADLAELNSLGDDFNALLDQVDAYQAKLMNENKSLSQMALHDGLTGLPNRSYFFDRMNNAMAAARSEGGGLAVLYFDCDNFKNINDSYGHAAGDALLVDLSLRIKSALRDSDVLARLGGDEFVVLLPHISHVNDAIGIARKLMASLDKPLTLHDGASIKLGVSIGIAHYSALSSEPIDASRLVERADRAMYQAKIRERGSIRLYEPGMDIH